MDVESFVVQSHHISLCLSHANNIYTMNACWDINRKITNIEWLSTFVCEINWTFVCSRALRKFLLISIRFSSNIIIIFLLFYIKLTGFANMEITPIDRNRLKKKCFLLVFDFYWRVKYKETNQHWTYLVWISHLNEVAKLLHNTINIYINHHLIWESKIITVLLEHYII